MSHRDAKTPNGRRGHNRPVLDGNADFPAFQPTTSSSLYSRLRCALRLSLVLIWAFWTCSIQAILIRLPGRLKIMMPRIFWKGVCRILGIKTRVIGQSAGGIRSARDVREGKRPVVFVANHCSWLDIAIIGSELPVVFVAKGEVGKWPLIGTASRLGRTIFVSRNRQETGRELQDMAERLWDGDDIVLFPEGTSSDGSRVLPFLSSFFAVAKPGRLEQVGLPKAPPVLIQPVSVVYDSLEGLPVGRSRRNVFSWYGDMDLAPHLWSFGQWRSMGASLMLHEPITPDDFRSRKELSQATFAAVNGGAAELRRGLPNATES
ncbi:lysophospholipid acyltransferase family protein [Gluconobacter roseus]|uniref:1-acyl-sn-glycerol-3-phosphate acyltransferase n=1 Tax=Gluconobacter roseus NBRC 3990 TaxID=1307950 RepID=A0A4Y3M3G8_9PROT|nr:lysophospholipid acyltransferase family protein [Gluconobacter roseus]KXV43801.1 acyl-phosphate glycerol 3-phosphate acyltransferase [Gluconobacter roseus]GBR45896.1 1-acyl-sn-glycerol-3-phosphate acyltransferase [Gluconobacter roseus NBRC 3990]GEB03134.1 1-acyl-sn-glycerol-3-phosphate acyltransferase [Gluconobacter roseus NBRC 3990]GLP93592.1 1-acyl-sn-glycerol-3-phosphate acyltransferase [Gluconobacter roseus NBRC 3990]